MIRKVLIAVAAGTLAVAALASAASGSHRRAQQESVATTTLMPGVRYTREVDFTSAGPVVLDVVTAPQPDGTVYTLGPELSNGSLQGTETLTGIEQRLRPEATTVGIDGDYFNRRTGVPNGILLRGGVLERDPAPGRSSLGIAPDGTLRVARVSFAGIWQGEGQPHALELNPVDAQAKYALYTPAFGPRTPKARRVGEAVLSSFPPTQLSRNLGADVTRVWHHGGIPIPPGGAVLVGRLGEASRLEAEAPRGAAVRVRLALSPNWRTFAGAIGGGPLLVEHGKPVFSAGEAFDPGALNDRTARGAVGELADGSLVLVTVEGGSAAYSVGMSSYELAVELVRLGATTAIGLGSGSPAGMAFDGTLLTRPSHGREARIADALVLSYTGVYVQPPAEPVLSPNGDGVADLQTLAYRLVRPSTVVASLVGPDGTTIPLAADSEQPGEHMLSWDGTVAGGPAPEGTWTFRVHARDDRGIPTKAQRSFRLDDTLGSLGLSRGQGRVFASFELTRAAQVVVRVERRNGVPVATLLTGDLQPGAHRTSWKRRIGGRRASPGRYQVEVVATSSVGTSSLVVPFMLR